LHVTKAVYGSNHPQLYHMTGGQSHSGPISLVEL